MWRTVMSVYAVIMSATHMELFLATEDMAYKWCIRPINDALGLTKAILVMGWKARYIWTELDGLYTAVLSKEHLMMHIYDHSCRV